MPKGVYIRTPEIIASLRKAARERDNSYAVKNLPSNVGRVCSEEKKKKLSESNKGQKRNIPSFWKGKALSEGTKIKISETLKGNRNASGGKGRVSPRKGVKLSDESKEKLRYARIKQIENTKNFGNGFIPNFNPEACEFFELYDSEMNTSGEYANHPRERCIAGYFVDYINDDLKIIMEYDEKHHYLNGILRQKDLKKQIIIQEKYPDYKFIRIKA